MDKGIFAWAATGVPCISSEFSLQMQECREGTGAGPSNGKRARNEQWGLAERGGVVEWGPCFCETKPMYAFRQEPCRAPAPESRTRSAKAHTQLLDINGLCKTSPGLSIGEWGMPSLRLLFVDVLLVALATAGPAAKNAAG